MNAYRCSLRLILSTPALAAVLSGTVGATSLPVTIDELRRNEMSNALPSRPPEDFGRADTVKFGYFQTIDGQYYAVSGEEWTWDHGSQNVYEGWYAVDQSEDQDDYFLRITAGSWTGHGNDVPAPIIDGSGSVWLGLFEDRADGLCWNSGLGYGNFWCQRLVSPEYTYGGAGEIHLSFTYFNNSEPDFDYTKVLLALPDSDLVLNGSGFTGEIGTPPNGPWAGYARTITQSELGGEGPRSFHFYFEFTSDGGWSDQDGDYPTTHGPFGFDDLLISGGVAGGPYLYNFEVDLHDWTPDRCPGIGSFFSIQPLSQYVILDPCACGLDGNVAAFHDGNYHHPVGQWVSAWSPPADRSNYQSYNKIFVEWDQYSEMPVANGVFYRPGWSYYPYLCPSTGQLIWSGRKGEPVWHYVGDTPSCATYLDVATDWGIPAECQLVGFVYEVYSSCDALGIPPTECSGETNFTPILDNVRIGMIAVGGPPPPQVMKYQDGFSQTEVLSVVGTGNANLALPLNAWPNPNNDPWRLGDSLVCTGPSVTPGTRWEAKLWFRLKREGPGQIHVAGYRDWKNRVADGRQIVGSRGDFTWGWMDSVEVGAQVYRNRFDSYFREDDDDYAPGPIPRPDIAESNEIIGDGILTPGSKVEYFVTANFICQPTRYLLVPDTAGGNYYDFEILPSYRTDEQTGTYKFPCLLHVNAGDTSTQRWLDGALNMALNGASPAEAFRSPDPTIWDRFDYRESTLGRQAPLFRNQGGNNGATLAQLLGYRFIVVNTGYLGEVTDVRDWQGFDTWLTTSQCNVNSDPRGFWATGDNIASIIEAQHPWFLNDRLGADLVCDGYNVLGCPPGEPENDQNYCVHLETVGSAWTSPVPVDLLGNWDPQHYSFDVIAATGTGFGQKSYRKLTSGYTRTDFAQVVNDRIGDPYNYRSVIDGYALRHLIEPLGSDPQTRCLFDTLRTLSAISGEVREILRWALNLDDPLNFPLCFDPCLDPVSAPDIASKTDIAVDCLYPSSPSPFTRSASIRFSLARTGPVRLIISDVNGRRVKLLTDGPLSAGLHVSVWDGRDDAGRPVPAGIYWSQLSASGYASHKRMVLLH